MNAPEGPQRLKAVSPPASRRSVGGQALQDTFVLHTQGQRRVFCPR